MESICSFSRKWQNRLPSGTDKSRLWSDPNELSLRWGPIFVHWHLWEAHPRSGLKDNFNLECAVTSYCTSSYNESLVRSDTHPRVHSLQFLKYLSCGEGGLLWALRVHTSGCWRWCWGIWNGRERKRERESASSVSRWCTKHVFFLFAWNGVNHLAGVATCWTIVRKHGERSYQFCCSAEQFLQQKCCSSSSAPCIQKTWIFSHFARAHSNPVTLRWSYHTQTQTIM